MENEKAVKYININESYIIQKDMNALFHVCYEKDKKTQNTWLKVNGLYL